MKTHLSSPAQVFDTMARPSHKVKFKPCVKASTPPHAKILNRVAVNHPFKETNSSIGEVPLTSPLLPKRNTHYLLHHCDCQPVPGQATCHHRCAHTEESQIHHNLHPTRMLNTQHPLQTMHGSMNCFVHELHGKTLVLSSVE